MERGAHPFRFGGPAAASLLVNALLIATLLNLGIGGEARRTDSPSLTVLSLAVLKGAEDGEDKAKTATTHAPATAAAPPAEPVPVAAVPSVEESVPPPMVMAPTLLPRPIPAPVPVGAHSATTPAAASAQRAMPTAAPAASPSRRGVIDGLDAKAPSGTSRSYAARVRSWLYAHKIYPRRARMRREEGSVQVRFVIDRAGVLIEGAIVRGSGNGTLDAEAAAMMQRASPFPRAPSDIPGDRIEFLAPIEFVLPV